MVVGKLEEVVVESEEGGSEGDGGGGGNTDAEEGGGDDEGGGGDDEENANIIITATNMRLAFTICQRWDCPGDSAVKSLPAMQETWVQSLGWSDPWEEHGNPLQHSYLENLMDRGSLVGYSPWGPKESDKAEAPEPLCMY